MPSDLQSLKIDRESRRQPQPSKWSTRWIIVAVSLLALLGVGRVVYNTLGAPTPVETVRVSASAAAADPGGVVLNAAGYIVAHH
jgi:hypothetical protein